MTANRTSMIAVALVALLMACTLAGVCIANGNSQSDTKNETATFTPVITIADSSKISSKEGMLTVNDVNWQPKYADLYSTWNASEDARGVTIDATNSKIALKGGTITIDLSLRSDVASGVAVLLSMPDDVSYDTAAKTLSIGTTVATAYLENCADSYLTLLCDSRLLGTTGTTVNTYAMATLKDLSDATDSIGKATITFKLTYYVDSYYYWATGKAAEVTTNLSKAGTYNLGWNVHPILTDSAYATLDDSASFKVMNVSATEDVLCAVITMTMPTDVKYNATVKATNNLDSRGYSDFSVMPDLSNLAYDCTVTFSLIRTTDRCCYNALAIAIPATDGSAYGYYVTLIYPDDTDATEAANDLTVNFRIAFTPTYEGIPAA